MIYVFLLFKENNEENMKLKLSILAAFTILFISCGGGNIPVEKKVTYNLIRPSAGIYEVYKKNVEEKETRGSFFEKNIFDGNHLVKIERYDKSGKLTDELFIPAITTFEYDQSGKVKYVKYFDKAGKPAETPKFNYSVIEYVYDSAGRVILEIYRDKNFELLSVPYNKDGGIADINFIAPVLAYLYNDTELTIKAFDKNFNLIKESKGKKPCVPFIDCGE